MKKVKGTVSTTDCKSRQDPEVGSVTPESNTKIPGTCIWNSQAKKKEHQR